MSQFIRVMAGCIGSGKSSCCVREMIARHDADPSRMFFTNLDVKPTLTERLHGRLCVLDPEQVVRFFEHTCPGSSVYLDEATIHFDSRNSLYTQKVCGQLTTYLMHVRKFDDDVTFICHKFEHLDKRIRDMATLFTHLVSTRKALEHFVPKWMVPEWFILRDAADVDFKQSIGWRLRRSSPWVWSYFDSYGVTTAAGIERLRAVDFAVSDVVGDGLGDKSGVATRVVIARCIRWAAVAVSVGVFVGVFL